MGVETGFGELQFAPRNSVSRPSIGRVGATGYQIGQGGLGGIRLDAGDEPAGQFVAVVFAAFEERAASGYGFGQRSTHPALFCLQPAQP